MTLFELLFLFFQFWRQKLYTSQVQLLLLRFSYYGNFGFGLFAFSLGFLLALFQLKEPKKEKSENRQGDGGEKKLVFLENLTNSFKVCSQILEHCWCDEKQYNNQFLHEGACEEEVRQPAPHCHSPCCSFHGCFSILDLLDLIPANLQCGMLGYTRMDFLFLRRKFRWEEEGEMVSWYTRLQ